MITEQRLRFEAKHPPKQNVVYRAKDNEYWYMRDGEYDMACHEYNILWRGYQSALEDRQGEAVADVIAIQPADMTATVKMKPLLNYGVPLSIGDKLFTSPQPAQPVQEAVGKIVEVDDETCGYTRSTHREIEMYDPAFELPLGTEVYASPQPAQPDQWNAAIEAAANECERLTWAIDHGGKKYRREANASQCKVAVIALRKGA
jgi:hypothetical protein